MLKQIIKKLIFLNVFFLFLMTVYRIIFTFYYVDISRLISYCLSNLIKAFVLGLRYDAAVLFYINIFVLLSLIILLFVGSKKFFMIFMKSLKYYYTFFVGSVVLISCMDFAFYYYYGEHINFTIFEIFNNKLSYLWFMSQNDHKLFLILLLILIFIVVLIFFISKYILEKDIINLSLNEIKIKYKILLLICLLALNFLSVEFAFNLKSDRDLILSYFTEGIDCYVFPQISLSPIYTFYDTFKSKIKNRNWILDFGYKNNIRRAFSDYLNVNINCIDENHPEQSLIKVTKYNRNIEEIKPNVVLIVMESLDSEIISYNSSSFNILGEFKKHLEEDVVFYNCLYSFNNTLLSLEGIMLNLVRLPMAKMPYCKYTPYLNKIITFGLNAYKKNKYLTIYISPYVNLNFDIYDNNVKNNDEDTFNNILRHLKINNGKKFIYAITISNHAPFIVPENYKPLPLNVSDKFKDTRANRCKNLLAFQYSCQKAGEFLTKFKKSKYADNTIIAITGDHGTRGAILDSGFSISKRRVPLYIYIPKQLMPDKKNINMSKIISHIDIMPTLYELSLSNISYYSMGANVLNDNKQIAICQDNAKAIITDSEYVCKYYLNSKQIEYSKFNKNKYDSFGGVILDEEKQEPFKYLIKKYKAGVSVAQYMLKKDRIIIK
ncbi:MAG: sulfatase-like hydrolase/transferase [Endomicrobiaceae bacterium]|nr:sulfatase-like hydrolase/transferase [Endomicrobiaceae bacterium]